MLITMIADIMKNFQVLVIMVIMVKRMTNTPLLSRDKVPSAKLQQGCSAAPQVQVPCDDAESVMTLPFIRCTMIMTTVMMKMMVLDGDSPQSSTLPLGLLPRVSELSDQVGPTPLLLMSAQCSPGDRNV